MSNETNYTPEYLERFKDRLQDNKDPLSGLDYLKGLTYEKLVVELRKNEERDFKYSDKVGISENTMKKMSKDMMTLIEELEEKKDSNSIISVLDQVLAQGKFYMQSNIQAQMVYEAIKNIDKLNNQDVVAVYFPENGIPTQMKCGDGSIKSRDIKFLTNAQEKLLERACNKPGLGLEQYAIDILVHLKEEESKIKEEFRLSHGDFYELVKELVAIIYFSKNKSIIIELLDHIDKNQEAYCSLPANYSDSTYIQQYILNQQLEEILLMISICKDWIKNKISGHS